MNDDKCIGCDSKGWVQVIDPQIYELHVGSNNTDLGEPQTADSCQHVPPHLRLGLVRMAHRHTEHCPGDCEAYTERCLICEAEKRVREEALASFSLLVSRWKSRSCVLDEGYEAALDTCTEDLEKEIHRLGNEK